MFSGLKEFGEAIRGRYGNNLVREHIKGGAEGELALDGDPYTFWSAAAGSHHSVLEVHFQQPITFDCALTMEWLNSGQNVQLYAIEVFKAANGSPSRGPGHRTQKYRSLCTTTASSVRLHIQSSVAEAHIREFQLYHLTAAAQ